MNQLNMFDVTGKPAPPPKPPRDYKPQTPRPYQELAIAAAQEAWRESETVPLLALATGAGKTTILSELVRRELTHADDPLAQLAATSGLKARRRALIIAHTEEIIFQLKDRVENQLGADYPGRIGVVMASLDEPGAEVVVATRQSLHEKRMAEVLAAGPMDYLFIDEAHHATDDNTYGAIVQALREKNPALKIVGFTATPKRTDQKALSGIFTDIVYEWMIPEGIKAGYLVPVRRLKIATQVNLSAIRTSRGDYTQSKLVSVLDTYNWKELAIDAYTQHIQPTGRKTLAFFPQVVMSQAFNALLNERGIRAAHIDAHTPKPERRQVLNAFHAGDIQCISNVGVLTEGFDAPSAECILLARPTRSETLFTQIVGRGLRPYPGKRDCLLIDLTVTDTKALKTGTLLGKMVTCEGCGCEFYFGLKACPECGTERTKRLDAYQCECGHVYPYSLNTCPECGRVRPPAEERERLYAGEGLNTYEQLFEGTFAAWHHGADGYFSCTLSFDDGALVIAPPAGAESLFRLLFIPKDKTAKPEQRDTGEDLVELMLAADAMIEEGGAKKMVAKNARWRGGEASEGQIKFLQSLGVPVAEGVSKGDASNLITHALSVKRAEKHMGASK